VTLIGRATELARLRANVARGRPTLLVGPIGAGKTHLLRALTAECPDAVLVPQVQPLRLSLLGLCDALFSRGPLHGLPADRGPIPTTWPETARLLGRLTVRELTGVVAATLQAQRPLLLLDQLEAATPAMAPVLDQLLAATTVIGATRDCRPGLQKLWWAFEPLELPPLSRDEAKALLWHVVGPAPIADRALFEARVLEQAAGNPHALVEMARQVEGDAPVPVAAIRDLRHGAGLRYLDLTPVIFVVAGGLIVARFVALGLEDRDLYILAGTLGGVFFVVRTLLLRRGR
jgi:hypothetical protein